MEKKVKMVIEKFQSIIVKKTIIIPDDVMRTFFQKREKTIYKMRKLNKILNRNIAI